MKQTKLIIMSDVHLCQGSWYGPTSEERLTKMISDLNDAYQKEPYDAILFLGDYSLDFWVYDVGGSYVHHKISNADRFVKEYLPKLTCPAKYLMPGNHEQYGNEKWKEITGFDRQFSVLIGGWLFILVDTFSGNLDPDYDSDGTYTTPDLAFIKTEMERCPDVPVVLCSHYFDIKKETAAFLDFLKKETRIAALFCGHDHICDIDELGEACGNKLLFHDGNYSYTGSNRPVEDCHWGWREVWISKEGLKTAYFTPASTMQVNGKQISCEAGYQKEAFVALP